jgi:hypothetical protein
MLIAEDKKEKNIAEYLLYMWQLEDLFRANNLDEKALYNFLILPLNIEDDAKKKEIWDWYKVLMQDMIREDIQKVGHRSEINELLNELSYLHQSLIAVIKDPKYIELYTKAKPHLELLKSKSGEKSKGDVETALNGLYGLLLLRLKKSKISDETQAAMSTFSEIIAYLSSAFKRIKNGDLPVSGQN